MIRKAPHIIVFLLTLLVPQIMTAAEYGLPLGSDAPSISGKDISGKEFDLKKSLSNGPVVLVFYRGGWCPYCNTQLRRLEKTVAPAVKKANGTLIGISVDRPDEGLKTTKKNSLSFRIMSDPDAKLVTAYNLKFKVPEKLVSKYKSAYEIDLEKSSGRKHHIIAVPAVVVIAKNGKIKYIYADENYKIRAPEANILKALQ